MNRFEDLIQPDLFTWERFEQVLTGAGPVEDAFLEDLHRLALGSNYAIAQLSRYPELITELAADRSFETDEEVLAEALSELTDEAEIKRQLRLFRHRKLVQIIYQDICRGADVRDTLQRLSELADALIHQALDKAQQILSNKHGTPVDHAGEPMQLNVIAMGKLGGGELNFSSDIDLICVFSDDGQLKGFGQLSHSQYFTHVVKILKRLLHDSTEDGFVYRVDLRLRPWGDSGPIVLSHNAFEHYYQLHGREWEQYAMVKARVITGSDSDRHHLQSIIRPFVYRRYHDYRVFDGLAQLKHQIDQQARHKKERNNIKTGPGGIREIEFFVQAFQILKGGRNHQLQTPSLFRAFQVLSEQQLTDQPSLDQMLASYRFLRNLENRIQMLNDQQTHDIPDSENHQQRISQVMGFDDWKALEQELKQHQRRVSEVFSGLFTKPESNAPGYEVDLHLDRLDPQQHAAKVSELGFRDVDAVDSRLREFYQSKALLFMSDKAKKRFQCFFPEMLKQVAGHDDQQELLERMLALLSAISGRSVYFELLYQNIPLLVKLVDLFASSAWIASEVTRHPIHLESLLYPDQLADRFNREKLERELCVQLANVSDDEELELDVLRQYKQAHTIVIATAELAGEIGTAEVSRYLTELAEIILQVVFDLAYRELTGQYGEPGCEIDGAAATPAFGILGYGKLGGFELHYQSDLDIIFLHDSTGSKQHTNGRRSIDNNTFFSRLAQKIISKITLLTAGGKLYEIDTRLRPDGASGMIVSSLAAYTGYQRNKAWVWEHQAIIRARYIGGQQRIQPEFEAIRREILTLERDPRELHDEILAMRERIYTSKNPPEGEFIDIKHSRGGMVDIEFLVQYWVLRHANKFASLCETTDNTGLLSELYRLQLISREDHRLGEIYQVYHRFLHARVLQNQSAEIPASLVAEHIDQVKSCWNMTFAIGRNEQNE